MHAQDDHLRQSGIIFWLCGNLRDVPNISPEIALMKNDDNDQLCIKMYSPKTDRKLSLFKRICSQI